MNSVVCILCGLIMLAVRPAIAGGGSNVNEHVKVTMSIIPKEAKPGEKVQVLIHVHPKKGFHVNVNPPMSVRFDNSDVITSVDSLETPRNEKTGYLEESKPVRQTITIARNARRGAVALKGSFTYFYCSDAEGWCSKFKQPFEVKVAIAK